MITRANAATRRQRVTGRRPGLRRAVGSDLRLFTNAFGFPRPVRPGDIRLAHSPTSMSRLPRSNPQPGVGHDHVRVLRSSLKHTAVARRSVAGPALSSATVQLSSGSLHETEALVIRIQDVGVALRPEDLKR